MQSSQKVKFFDLKKQRREKHEEKGYRNHGSRVNFGRSFLGYMWPYVSRTLF